MITHKIAFKIGKEYYYWRGGENNYDKLIQQINNFLPVINIPSLGMTFSFKNYDGGGMMKPSEWIMESRFDRELIEKYLKSRENLFEKNVQRKLDKLPDLTIRRVFKIQQEDNLLVAGVINDKDKEKRLQKLEEIGDKIWGKGWKERQKLKEAREIKERNEEIEQKFKKSNVKLGKLKK